MFVEIFSDDRLSIFLPLIVLLIRNSKKPRMPLAIQSNQVFVAQVTFDYITHDTFDIK